MEWNITLIKGTAVTLASETAVSLTTDEAGSQLDKRAVIGQPFNPLCGMNNDGKVDANDFLHVRFASYTMLERLKR
jgi:hypothetical protein